MSQFEGSNAAIAVADLPPGAAPAFGDVPEAPFENEPEHLVLSSEAHQHLSGDLPFPALDGTFSHYSIGNGRLAVYPTALPGEVRLEAIIATPAGSVRRLRAKVRASWLSRIVAATTPATVAAEVVSELASLAAIPDQTTVTVTEEPAQTRDGSGTI